VLRLYGSLEAPPSYSLTFRVLNPVPVRPDSDRSAAFNLDYVLGGRFEMRDDEAFDHSPTSAI
jgi:hypothetical protein